MSLLILLVVAVIIVVFWSYLIYTSLIRKRNKAQDAFYSIDVQLKKRYDLIPSSLMARMLNIKTVDFIKEIEQERRAIRANDFFKIKGKK